MGWWWLEGQTGLEERPVRVLKLSVRSLSPPDRRRPGAWASPLGLVNTPDRADVVLFRRRNHRGSNQQR